jgi:hypothetical protein
VWQGTERCSLGNVSAVALLGDIFQFQRTYCYQALLPGLNFHVMYRGHRRCVCGALGLSKPGMHVRDIPLSLTHRVTHPEASDVCEASEISEDLEYLADPGEAGTSRHMPPYQQSFSGGGLWDGPTPSTLGTTPRSSRITATRRGFIVLFLLAGMTIWLSIYAVVRGVYQDERNLPTSYELYTMQEIDQGAHLIVGGLLEELLGSNREEYCVGSTDLRIPVTHLAIRGRYRSQHFLNLRIVAVVPSSTKANIYETSWHCTDTTGDPLPLEDRLSLSKHGRLHVQATAHGGVREFFVGASGPSPNHFQGWPTGEGWELGRARESKRQTERWTAVDISAYHVMRKEVVFERWEGVDAFCAQMYADVVNGSWPCTMAVVGGGHDDL